jgi:hypothetical protein
MKWTWLPRSRMLTPFFVAITGSPSKDAARCPNSVQSSTRPERALRTEQALDVHAAQRGCGDAVAELLRPDVAHEVGSAVRMAVSMAVETGDAAACVLRAAVFRLVELLLWKRRQEQAEPLDLLRIEQAY